MGKSHGMYGTPAYNSWISMKKRCYYKNHVGFKHWGGRGIQVCDEWRNSFENFYRDMGDRPEGCSLDRIDNDGDYYKENCRWASETEQKNNRRNNHRFLYEGVEYTAPQLSSKFGIRADVILYRISAGWELADALTRPVAQENTWKGRRDKRVWTVHGVDFPTAKEAARAAGMSERKIRALCHGPAAAYQVRYAP